MLAAIARVLAAVFSSAIDRLITRTIENAINDALSPKNPKDQGSDKSQSENISDYFLSDSFVTEESSAGLLDDEEEEYSPLQASPLDRDNDDQVAQPESTRISEEEGEGDTGASAEEPETSSENNEAQRQDDTQEEGSDELPEEGQVGDGLEDQDSSEGDTVNQITSAPLLEGELDTDGADVQIGLQLQDINERDFDDNDLNDEEVDSEFGTDGEDMGGIDSFATGIDASFDEPEDFIL